MDAQNWGDKSPASSNIETKCFSYFSPKLISSRFDSFSFLHTIKSAERKNKEMIILFYWVIRPMDLEAECWLPLWEEVLFWGVIN